MSLKWLELARCRCPSWERSEGSCETALIIDVPFHRALSDLARVFGYDAEGRESLPAGRSKRFSGVFRGLSKYIQVESTRRTPSEP